MDLDETWQETSPQRPLPSLCFSCRSEIQDGRPGLWLVGTFFNFFSTTVEWILRKLDRKQFLKALYQVCVFHADRKPKIAALASDWLKHFFDFFSATAEWILMKLDRKQFLRALYHVCDFLAIHKSKMAALASDWLKHFSTSTRQRLNGFWWILKLADRKSKMAALASDLLKHFSTSPQPLNGFWRNLTGNKSSTSLPSLCFFRADQKSKMATLAFDWLKHFLTSSPQLLNGFWGNLIGSNSSKPSI